ncbi:MAG: acyl--CoA ligase [Bacilli bacterium]|nr:acyl--CoA ligase [Bacilli bacterium]
MKINPNMSKYDYMLESSKNNMNSIALTFEDRKITYEEMFESIEKYAKLLHSKGVRKGDLIGVCTLNTPESVYLIYALNLLGAVVIGYSPFDNAERVKGDIELTTPKMVITTDLFYKKFRDLEKSLNFSTILYSPLESSKNWKMKLGYDLMQIKNGNFTLVRNKRLGHLLKMNYDGIVLPDTPYIDGELSDIMFTGGSTGVHKGVELNDVGLNSALEGMKDLCPEGYYYEKTYLGQIPFGHMAFGRAIVHIALTNRMTLALTLKAMPNDFYDELVRTKAHVVSGGPPHWTSLIEKKDGIYVPRSDLKPNTLNNLQVAFSGGEAKKQSTEEPINEALKFCGSRAKLGDGLGATETWGANILNFADYYKKGTIGVPISTLKVKLVNPDTGEEVKQGESGILYLSGTPTMMRYYNNPEETEKVISYDEDGTRWLNLGDYLQEDEEGFYRYVGRQKRNFVCGCDNIYPEQIEELLSTFPEVREAVVTPISDDLLQYIPSYHISLYSSDVDYDAFESKMKKMIKEKICESALPGKIEYFVDPLVRMPNSKVDIEYYKKRDLEVKNKVKEKTI